MTISSTNSRNNYTGTDSTDTYDFTFLIFNAEDLLVTQRDSDGEESTLTLGDDFTVVEGSVNNPDGGSITLTAGNLPSGEVLSIRRVRTLSQDTDIRNQGDFLPEVHEDTFDALVMNDQQQQDEIDRSMKLPESFDPSDFSTSLPANVTENPGRALIINSDGDGFDVGPNATDIANAQPNAAAAALSATAAETAAALAEDWATKTDGEVADGEFSAKKYAQDAAESALTLNSPTRETVSSGPLDLELADSWKVFLIDTTSGAITVNLPAPTDGIYFVFKDTAGLFGTNKVSLVRDDSADTIEGVAADYDLESPYGCWGLIADGSGWHFVVS
jgi:hypothetical protein